MLQGWRPLDPLINPPRDPRRENPVSADLEHPRPLPDPEKQCKTIGQAQPYRLPFPPQAALPRASTVASTDENSQARPCRAPCQIQAWTGPASFWVFTQHAFTVGEAWEFRWVN